jgi:hypothetical protein
MSNLDASILAINEIGLNTNRRNRSILDLTNIDAIFSNINNVASETLREIGDFFENCQDIIIGEANLILDQYNSNENNNYFLYMNDYGSIVFDDGYITTDLHKVTLYNIPELLMNIPSEILEEGIVEVVILEIGVIRRNKPICLLPPGFIPPPKKSKRK